VKIIDRYFLGYFMTILVFSLGAAAVVFVVVDLVEHLDKFIDRHVPINIVIHYYLLYLPYIFYLILPVGMLLASLFAMGHFMKTNEFLAMKASGISLYRLYGWVVALGIVLSFGDLALGETVVPFTNKIRLDIYRYQVKKVPKPTTSRRGRIYLQNSPTEFVYIDYFDPQPRTAFRVTIQTVDKNRLLRRIDAERMEYRNERWILHRIRDLSFQGDEIVEQRTDQMNGSFLTFEPKDLTNVQIKPEEMNYFELKDFINNLLRSGNKAVKWIVDLNFKLSTPFTNLIIVIFGLPLAAMRRKGGVMVVFGIGLFVCFIYFGCIQITKIMGYNGTISPDIAAWSANGLFGLVGFMMLFWVRK
jgi:lipopolysaccharide export system permease protein